ncbi:hypothetical protein CYLTODRAFT_247073 [Cylindrobasidium torrendii FP15055 ss-10]|uniref:F-box domain-containing protein n=1 Tax=Cylindrobasidium torrendii FP15055 ss-10 TaxID=1314674 RepID=A0A0D7ATD0_9AGAR|nr:hypothetical protein CYLTODRAFT_247073 [Cylindrobasidium torrendii FP15055 ss-10]
MAPKSLQRSSRKRGREASESPPPAKRRTRASIKSSGEVIPDIFRPVYEDDDDGVEGDVKASGLRVRPKPRGRLGRLEAISDMPVELLYAILCHLTPLDLLHLARTSKDLRALLLSRHSSDVWVAARESFSGIFDSNWDVHDNRAVVIPPPPVWMSEPS